MKQWERKEEKPGNLKLKQEEMHGILRRLPAELMTALSTMQYFLSYCRTSNHFTAGRSFVRIVKKSLLQKKMPNITKSKLGMPCPFPQDDSLDSKAQDSLCRFFLNYSHSSDEAEQRNDAKGMSVVLNIGKRQTLEDSTSRSQVLGSHPIWVAMCPSEPISLAADIIVPFSDEEVVMSLDKLACENPLSAIVLAETSHNLLLWSLRDDLKATETGCWVGTGEYQRIYTNFSSINSTTTVEFYKGQVPRGCDIGKPKESLSLSTVFFNCSQTSDHEVEKRNDATPVMLNIGTKRASANSTSRSQGKRFDEHGNLLVSRKYLEGPRSGDSHAIYDFSGGDYFELAPEGYFATSALFRDIDSGKYQDTEKNCAGCKLCTNQTSSGVFRPERLARMARLHSRCLQKFGDATSTLTQEEVTLMSSDIHATALADQGSGAITNWHSYHNIAKCG